MIKKMDILRHINISATLLDKFVLVVVVNFVFGVCISWSCYINLKVIWENFLLGTLHLVFPTGHGLGYSVGRQEQLIMDLRLKLSLTDKFLYESLLSELSRHCIQFAYYMSKNDQLLSLIRAIFGSKLKLRQQPKQSVIWYSSLVLGLHWWVKSGL